MTKGSLDGRAGAGEDVFPGGDPTLEVDLLVVGAGPAGSLAAFLAARAGASVVLVERSTFPRWKVCGACLNGAAGSVLREAGLGHIPEMGRPLERLTVQGWGRTATLPVTGSVALTRRTMDQALMEAARDAGAVVLHGTATGLGTVERHPGGDERRVVRIRAGGQLQRVSARVVVDAAGLSGLRDGGGDPSMGVSDHARIGVGAVYPVGSGDWAGGVIHMVTGAHGYVGLVRTEEGALNVAGALHPDFVRVSGGPEGAVRTHLEAAGMPVLHGQPLEGWRGTPALTRTPQALAGHRWFRVGDAAGYVEPFTGEGMAWALGGAAALVPLVLECLRAWSPGVETRWSAAHRRQVGARQRLCRGVTWLSRRPALARAGLGLLGSAPWLASPLTRHTARPFSTHPPDSTHPILCSPAQGAST